MSPRKRTSTTIFWASSAPHDESEDKSHTFVIGKARRKDVSSLARLFLANIEDVVPQGFTEIQKNLHSTAVVRTDGRVVASASLRALDKGTCELRGLIVSRKWRGFGLAERLVKRLIRQARRSGRGLICVTRHPDFFRRYGFRRVPRKGEDGMSRAKPGTRVEMVLPIAVPPREALATEAQRAVEDLQTTQVSEVGVERDVVASH